MNNLFYIYILRWTISFLSICCDEKSFLYLYCAMNNLFFIYILRWTISFLSIFCDEQSLLYLYFAVSNLFNLYFAVNNLFNLYSAVKNLFNLYLYQRWIHLSILYIWKISFSINIFRKTIIYFPRKLDLHDLVGLEDIILQKVGSRFPTTFLYWF